MERTRSSEHLRYRYGICLNDNCEKCKTKETQQIAARKDFVCAECGKTLREVAPPQSFMDKYGKAVIGGGIVAAIALVGGGIALFGGSDSKESAPIEQPAPAPEPPTAGPDTTAVAPEPEKEPEAKEPKQEEPTKAAKPKQAEARPQTQNGYGTLKLAYGTYTGDIKNGKPHGHGTIVYSKSHKIVASQDYVASPGDKYEGDFRDGNVSGGVGYWYHNGDITGIKP